MKNDAGIFNVLEGKIHTQERLKPSLPGEGFLLSNISTSAREKVN